jgi:2-iminobutanoate/2-iminopropanoate deaminase
MSRTQTLSCGLVAALMLSHHPALESATSQSAQPVARHGGLIYVSGIMPGPAPAALDFAAQAGAVITELSARLTRTGSSLQHVVSTTVYLKQASDFPALNEAWRRAWPAGAPTRTTVIADLPAPGALIQVSAIAVPSGAERRIIRPAAWPPPPSPYSYAIQTGDMVFVSGLVPRRGVDNTPVTGDMGIQTRAVMDNARTILDAAGLTIADVVSARIYITDPAQFQAMNEAYRTYLPTAPPARATVRSGLTNPDYLVEVTLTAVRGSHRVTITTPGPDGSPGKPNPNLSSAIGVGHRLFLSGMLGMLPGNANDTLAQTKETLARLGRTMATAGFAWPHVVDAIVYVTDVTQAAAVTAAMQVTMGHMPPVTVVGSGLMSPDGKVEIMLVAGK